MDLTHLWAQAGLFARGIVITLAIMSIWSLTVTFQKWLKIRKSQNATKKFAPQFSRAIQ